MGTEVLVAGHVSARKIAINLPGAGNVEAAVVCGLAPGTAGVTSIGVQLPTAMVTEESNDAAALGEDGTDGIDHVAAAQNVLNAMGSIVTVTASHSNAASAPRPVSLLQTRRGEQGSGNNRARALCDIPDALEHLVAVVVVVGSVNAVGSPLRNFEGSDSMAGDGGQKSNAELHIVDGNQIER